MTPSLSTEILPESLPARGTLYLNPPLDHTLEKLRATLRAAGLEWSEPAEHVIALDVATARQGLLDAPLHDQLSQRELAGTKCVVLEEDRSLAIADLGRTQPFDSLLARLQAQWLVELLRDRLLITYFQPIVRCAEPDEVFAYECLLRGMTIDGQLIHAGPLYAAARASDMLYQLDRQSRWQHVHAVANRGITRTAFINFNPTAIYDPAHCLKSTVEAVHATGIAPERFVFEVVESEETRNVERLARIFDYLRGAGFRVALDDFGAGYNSVNLLNRARPDFVKLDMHLVRGINRDWYKGQITAKILDTARDMGVATIVEGIETVEEFDWARQHGADYAQGFLFGYPAPQPQQPLPLPAAVEE